MTYTLGQAAKATGKSKPTISRAIKKGKISAFKDQHGQYCIEPSELHRVYRPVTPETGTDVNNVTTSNPIDDRALRREIELLNERLDEKDEIIQDLREQRDKWQEQAASLLIASPDKGRSFWRRLTGKGQI